MSSGCLCNSAERPAWNGGSNQNQRSVGNAAVILTSAIRNWSSNTWPANSAPTICRSDERAPSQATTKSACEPVRTVRRLDRQHHMVVALLQSGHLVAPAQVDRRQFLHPVDQIGLGIELLQVDEGRPLVALLRQQVELIELRVAVKDLADAPDHALVDHALADAEPVPEFQRAFREADRARALADPVGIVEQHDGLAALRQIDRQRQPDRPGADHDDGVTRGVAGSPILVGVTTVAELGFDVCAMRSTGSGQRPAMPAMIVSPATILNPAAGSPVNSIWSDFCQKRLQAKLAAGSRRGKRGEKGLAGSTSSGSCRSG